MSDHDPNPFCNPTYPFVPCSPATSLSAHRPDTALTGQELHDPIAAFLVLGAVGLLALLGSLRHFSSKHFVRR